MLGSPGGLNAALSLLGACPWGSAHGGWGRGRRCPGPSSGARGPPLSQEEEFGLYALYSKNKPQSDALLCSHGNAFFKVTPRPRKPRCPRPGPG